MDIREELLVAGKHLGKCLAGYRDNDLKSSARAAVDLGGLMLNAADEIDRLRSEAASLKRGHSALTRRLMMPSLYDIAAERKRQMEIEGYDAGHDDAHSLGDLTKAAAAYAVSAVNSAIGAALWPWRIDEFRPDGARRNLVKAGALILAAIDWIDRAAQKQDT
jgi:hypothetical protein